MFYTGVRNQAQQFLNNYRAENPATYAAAQQAIGGLLILDGFIGIDNPFGGKKRSGIFGSLIGVIVGLFLVFGTGFIGNFMGINKLTGVTTATVVSVSQPTTITDSDGNSSSSSCTAQAKYTVNGTEYTQTATSGSSSACSLTAGQTIEINYDPSNPSEWAYDLNTVKTVLKIVPFIGALVALTSLVTFIIRLLSIIFGWKILRSGRALARTLPAGTDLSTIKNEIQKNFAQNLIGAGTGGTQPQTTIQNQAPAQAVPQPQTQNDPPQPPQTPPTQ